MRRGQKPEAKAPTLATSQEGPPSQYGHTPRQKLIPPISMWHDIRVSLIDKLIALLLDSPSAAVEWTPVDLNGLQLERKVHEPIEVAPAQSTRGKLERRIITALLHFVVAQFGVTVDSHCAKQGSTSEIVGASIPQTCTVPKKPIPTKPASNARSRGSNRTSTRNQTTSSKSQASSLQPPACARLQAARAFVSALQYASYLDCTGQSQEVLRTQEIKLLCLVSLASLCKQLDADKLRCLFSLNSTWIDISEAQGAQIVIDAIVETVIALIDHDCYNRIAGTVYYTESVIFRMSWLAHEAFAGLVVAVHVASEKSGLNGVSLADSLILRCLEGLQQLMKRNSECTASQMKLIIAIYADFSNLLPRAISCLPLLTNQLSIPTKSSRIQILSHPILLIKQIINPIIHQAIWHPSNDVGNFAVGVLETLVTHIRESSNAFSTKCRTTQNLPTASLKKVSLQFDGLYLAKEFREKPTWVISDGIAALNETLVFLEVIAQWLSNMRKKNNETTARLFSPLLEHKSACRLSQWVVGIRVHVEQILRLFLLPFLEQVAAIGGEENWNECANIIVCAYNGSLAKGTVTETSQDESSKIQTSIHYMTRWLISTSRADLANAGGSWKEGINLMARSIPPSVECALNLRLFCIRVLGILTHANREVSICLLSLFSDTKPTVRDAAARAMSIRSLNNDPLNFHAQICSSASRRSVHHRESGDCICSADPDKYSFGHSDLDRYAPNQAPSTYFGLSASLKYPFKNLIWCLDATIGSKNDLEGDGETKIFWQGSSDERATVGRLAFYVARHMFSICPVLANPDFSSKYSSNLHLPVLSDPRYKAALRAIQELETRYKRHSSVRSTDSVPEKLDQSWCMCQCITLCVVGILEGSKSVDMVPNCDPRVLRAASPLLFQIRVNDSASIRIILLEALARMLGLGALVDEMNETGGWENKFVTDSLLKNSSFVDSESLNIVYRVVRGMAPLDTLAIAQRDDIDNHPRVASLRDALLNYFEISLVRSLRHSPEESRSYRPVHFPTSHNEIPQKCISTFDWAKRMNSNLFFKRVSVANLNSPTLPETLHIEARQDLSQYSSAEINPVEHTEVVSSILQRMDKEEIDLLATYSNRLLRSELQVQQGSHRKHIATDNKEPLKSDSSFTSSSALLVAKPPLTEHQNNGPLTPEAAASVFRKTEQFFYDALPSIQFHSNNGLDFIQVSSSPLNYHQKTCLDRSLDSIINEHEYELKQIEDDAANLQQFHDPDLTDHKSEEPFKPIEYDSPSKDSNEMPLRNNSLNQAPPSNFVGSELYSASELPSLSHFISSSASRLLNTRARPDFSTYPETIRSSALPSPKLLSRSTTVEPSPVDDSIRSSSVRNSSSQRSSLGSKDGLPNSELRNSSHQLSINLHEKYPRPACISTSAASSESVPVQLSPFSSHLRRSTGSESRSSIALADRGISLTSLASRNSLKRGKESQTTSNSEIIFPAEFPSNKNSSGDVRMDLDELIPIPSIEKAETKKIDLNAFLSRNRLELQSPKRFNQLDLGTSHLNLLTSADIFHDDKFGVFLASKSNPITPLYCDKENESEVLPTPQPKFENPVLNNEPSGILMTPGSPISFSWSGIEGDWPLGNAEENSEAKDYDERTQSHELSRRMAEDSKPNANAATLSFFQSMGHLAGNPTSSMIRPRLRSSLELVLRHLVFSRKETSSILSVTSQDGINYYELYGNGLVYGSSHNLATFPVAGEASDRGAIRHTYMEDEPPVNEALHSLLKDVFYLDMSLMVDLCGPMMMGKSASRCLSSDSNREDCLHNWLSGLTEVHRHLLPASRALWQMEVQMSSQLTLAQGMVVVKDQIELSRMTGGNVGLSVVEGLNFRNTSGGGVSFLEWINLLFRN